MPLNQAHEGYEYQDLLATYFILDEILQENESEFKIDTKEYDNDKFDDLTIINKNGIFKKQIKYSNYSTSHKLEKKDLSSSGSYELALDDLFFSWLSNPKRNEVEIRLCLAWNSPIDDLKEILIEIDRFGTFKDYQTKVFKIDLNIFWPVNKDPLKSWRRFNSKSKDINKEEFCKFIDKLIIEINFPKFSLDIEKPGDLENIVLEQADKLGIGIYPNQNRNPDDFIKHITYIVKRSRALNTTITTIDILKKYIHTDYGSINQSFPIDSSKNIVVYRQIDHLFENLKIVNKIIITGEPGSGKSWFLDNLINAAKKDSYKIVKHYCHINLEDELQKERIKIDVFYGNLIKDIIIEFPHLKIIKEKLYASNLNELNLLLNNIDEPTLLVVDGLDHIERVFNFRDFKDISEDQIDIINEINKIKCSEYVKIIIASQPIKELENIKNFGRVEIEKWNIEEIQSYLEKTKIEDKGIDNNLTISSFLFNKSNGNPLYVKYLTDEIKKIKDLTIEKLECFPDYSINLLNYYEYLISKLNLKEQLPRILSGVGFYLTKNELIEITGEGEYINEELDMLLPVLKLNISKSGYIIYHESFRRFILDNLKNKNLSLTDNIIAPIISWFETKGVFEYPKAFRFYFQFAYECGFHENLYKYVTRKFVTESIYWGYTWDIIIKNYKYLLKAISLKQDFVNLIILNELNRILASTKDEFYEIYEFYFEALGYLRGFKYVSDYLTFEELPTIELRQGLLACSLCEKQNVSAPWELYIKYFEGGKGIEIKDFYLYIQYLLKEENLTELIRIADEICQNNLIDYKDSFANELIKYANKDFIAFLFEESDSIKTITNFKKGINILQKDKLEEIVEDILKTDYLNDELVSKIKILISQIKYFTNEKEFIEDICTKLSCKNWFFNWIIYSIKIELIKESKIEDFNTIKEAFLYLTYDTEPFKGKPRTCDLYSIEKFIYDTLKDGLELIKTTNEWIEIIDIFVKLSEDTTTNLYKSLNGPLHTNKLFKILDEISNNENIHYIIKVLKSQIKESQGYQLHAYLSEFHFRLSKLNSKIGNLDEADKYFSKGIIYGLGYTFRKDPTIGELIECVEPYSRLFPDFGNKYIKEIKVLVDSVVNHTDGKGTQQFPIEWFNKYTKINYCESCIYLLNQLKEERYYWILEDSLIELLKVTEGNVNPLIELLIARTFILESSEPFLTYCTNICENVKELDITLSTNFFIRIYEIIKNVKDNYYSDEFIKIINKMSLNFNLSEIPNNNISKKTIDYSSSGVYKELLLDKCYSRKSFSDMTLQEIIDYFEEYGIRQDDLISLYYLFKNYNQINYETKKLIKYLVQKYDPYHSYRNSDLDIIFQDNLDLFIYFWICRFVYDRDGWYNELINFSALKKAYELNKNEAIKYFFELVIDKLNINFPHSFSSNLIINLIKLEYDSSTINSMLENLFYSIDYRLPTKESFVWKNALSNELDMNIEEIFICILFTRFNANTSERFHLTLSGIGYLLYTHPQKLIKPIKWFFKNHSKFLDSILLSILQLLYEFCKDDKNYINNFRIEILEIYPMQYFFIDTLIELLLSIEKSIELIPESILVYPEERKGYNYFINLNYRHRILKDTGLDTKNVYSKFKNTFGQKYGKYLELYYNSLNKIEVKNIYDSDYILEIINKNYYNFLNKYSNKTELIKDLKINVNTLIAQNNSQISRPLELLKPSEENNGMYDLSSKTKNNWVQIGYFEKELKEEKSYLFDTHIIFGGAIFLNPQEITFPFSDHLMIPNLIYENKYDFDLDPKIVFSIFQKDSLENYKILWLNPEIIKILNLIPSNFLKGLSAVNESGEIVLKYNSWRCEYLKISDSSNIDDEIPKLDGAELIIRRDYFDRICELFPFSPVFINYKI